jgi:transposase
MLYVGIDVSKDKHDCFIASDDGESESFVIRNTKAGFLFLLQRIKSFQPKPSSENTKTGLEATGHYSYNITAFLRSVSLSPVVFNPLQTNLYRKANSLRKTKTDKGDARSIAKLLMTGDFKPFMSSSYHTEELKWLTRHRQRLVRQQSVHKVAYARLLNLVFPELSSAVSSTDLKAILAMLAELPGTDAIAHCHLKRLTNILHTNSKGHWSRNKAVELRELAKDSIGTNSPALALEMQQTIRLLGFYQTEIDMIEQKLKEIIQEMAPPILGIPGIGFRLASIIMAEIGDIHRFTSASKLQAYAGLDPTTYQSGNFSSTQDKMVKRGSTYLRWALFIAGQTVSKYDPMFAEVLSRKQAEGKHYNVAVSHVAKKLIRVMYHLLSTDEQYTPAIA